MVKLVPYIAVLLIYSEVWAQWVCLIRDERGQAAAWLLYMKMQRDHLGDHLFKHER